MGCAGRGAERTCVMALLKLACGLCLVLAAAAVSNKDWENAKKKADQHGGKEIDHLHTEPPQTKKPPNRFHGDTARTKEVKIIEKHVDDIECEALGSKPEGSDCKHVIVTVSP